MKGDRVEVVVDTGNGVQTFEITARRAGRRVDISVARGVVEVSELTRGGTPVRTGRFMANRIIAMVEHPAADVTLGEEAPEDPRGGQAYPRPRQIGRPGEARGRASLPLHDRLSVSYRRPSRPSWPRAAETRRPT